jgi:GNAT superfamily N-acetyltransferase
MLQTEFTIITPDDRPDYGDLVSVVSEVVWPEFMHHDAVAIEHWDALFDWFSEYQFALLKEGEHAVAGFANGAPLCWRESVRDLPAEGWDWAFAKSVSDHVEGREPNVLCGLQIAIAPDFQGRGLSKVFLDEMIRLARSRALRSLIVPVRPSMKHRYPLTPIGSYIQWEVEQGLPFDPWLRVHVRSGGRIVKPCPRAMRISGKVSDWQEWTGLRFFESGEYVVPGALVPVGINVEEDVGTYVEPNVWVVHDVGV